MNLVLSASDCSKNNRNFSYSFNNIDIIPNSVGTDNSPKQNFDTRNIDLCKIQSYETLNRIASLRDNRNQYGAKRFSKELVEYVRTIIDKLGSQPDIFPTARNSIQLEYEKIGDFYLEFEIFGKNNIKMFSILKKSNKTITKKITDKELIEVVKRYYGH